MNKADLLLIFKNIKYLINFFKYLYKITYNEITNFEIRILHSEYISLA